jgi:hypothetical protein
MTTEPTISTGLIGNPAVPGSGLLVCSQGLHQLP